jgi:transposase
MPTLSGRLPDWRAAGQTSLRDERERDPICFSPFLYRARNRIERFFNRIKQCRRIATRYDNLAESFLAFVKLAAIRLWVRANEPTP